MTVNDFYGTERYVVPLLKEGGGRSTSITEYESKHLYPLSERVIDRPVIHRRALRFDDPQNLSRALDIIQRLREEQPLGLLKAPSPRRPSAILSAASYARLAHALEEANVQFREVPVVPVSGLPVEDQKRIRRGSP